MTRRVTTILMLGLALACGWRAAGADTTVALFESFAGNVNFVGTQQTLRTQSDAGNSCAVTAGGTTTTLAGLPAGATVEAAYLYWAGSGDTPDYNVTFDGSALAADPARSYTATFSLSGTDYNYFSGVADVTAAVAAKGNGSYDFSGLTVDNGNPWCASSAVLGGWALLVIYSEPSEDFRVINLYEGFQHFRGSDITLNPSNFLIPTSPINGRNAHLTWEGDVGNSAALNGFVEALTFNGNALTDANNPANNQFNSVSTMSIPVDTTSYGVDFDVFDISPYLAAGQTSATTVYSSGGDLVLLSAQVISTTNAPVSDLAISMTRNGALVPGQNASYALNVSNNGPLSEPGPITVVDTLPAQLSYVSASGTGWSCSAVGQTVTCTRAGALASGASAAALTLTVGVSAGASGAITNTATVDGQNFDNVPGNDTATDTYALLPAAYAYYAMDELSWGAVTDSSGNGRDATATGAAAATGYPPPSPPGSAIPGNPGTCGMGSIPSSAGSGVDTGIDINSLGNAGTIAFWYSSNTVWNDNNDRMLLDASNNLGGANADKHFYVVKGDGGEIRFGLEDDDDDDELISTGQNSFPANEWHHIAITWEWGGSNRMRLYLDGVEQDNEGLNDNIGNYAALYLGMTHTGIQGTDTDFTTNTANGYLDEVRIFNGALSASDIAAIMAATHSCGLDHIRIEHGSGTGLTCNPSTLTIRACADAACSSPYTGGVSGTLTATGAPTVNWVGGTGFSIPFGASTVTKDFQVTTPGDTVLGTSGVTPVPGGTSPVCNFGAPSCTFAAADSGFVFDVPHHTAAITQNVVLAAVRTDDVTQRCVPAFQNVARTVNFWSSYLDPNSGTLAVNVNGSNIAGGSPGTGLSLNFDANGETALSVSYPDVGEMRVNASHIGSGDAAGLVMTGQDNFVARPARFELVFSPANPEAVDASGGVFTRAGQDFTITVEARNASDSVTPNYGRESSPESVQLAKVLVAPAGGNDPALTGSFGAFGQDCSGNPVAAGTACGTFNWTEAGIIQLTPSVADGDYLTAGNVSGTAKNVGRFIPDHFTVTGGSVVNRVDAACAPASAFTYMGEMLRLGFTLTAQSASPGNTTTENYTGAFAKLDPTNIAAFNIGAIDAAAPTPLTGRLATDTSSGPWNNGIATIQARLSLNRAAAADGPFQALRFGIAPADTDGVTVLAGALDLDVNNDSINDRALVVSSDVRYGRLSLQNAFGSELVALPMPFRAQYYGGNTTGFITNTADSCTAVALASLNLTSAVESVAGDQPIEVGAGVTTQASFATATFAGGDAGLSFSAPGAGGDGYVDVEADSGTPSWLKFDWDGNGGTPDVGPTGRATFGIYQGNPRHIYIRERY